MALGWARLFLTAGRVPVKMAGRKEPLLLQPANLRAMEAGRLGLLLRERQAVAMSEREMDAYEETFHRHSFTPRQFKRLLEAGEWRDVAPATASPSTLGGGGRPARLAREQRPTGR